MIEATCNLCNTPYEIDDSAAGMQIQCPSCGQAIIVEAAAPTPPSTVVQVGGPVGAPGSGAPGVVWASQGDRQNFKPGYTNIMCWVYTALTALVCTMLIHGILAFVSLKFNPISAWILLYLPIIPGVLAGASIFTNEALKNSPERIPTLQMALGVSLSILLSVGPAFLTASIQTGKVQKALVTAISIQTAAPHFVIGGKAVGLMAVNLGSPDKAGNCTVDAVYSNNKTYSLQAIRNVSKVVQLSGLPKMKADMVMQNHRVPLTRSIQKYAAAKKATVKSFKIISQTKPGRYSATATLSLGFDVEVIMQLSKQTMKFVLTSKSRRELAAIVEVNKIWKEFDSSGTTVCTKVVLGEETEPLHWNATAHLTGDKEKSIFIQETTTDDITSIQVFFPPKETAILKINEIIRRTGEFAGRTIDEKCVNLKKMSTIRVNQDSMQAQFVQESPADAIITSNGYDVRVLPGKWTVMRSNDRNKTVGWSLFLPTTYQISADPNDTSIKIGAYLQKSDEAEINQSMAMNAKEFSDVSKFSLSDYVNKERSDWTGKYPTAAATAIESFNTHSGLKGYSYTAKNKTVFRAKYFFKNGNSLAILTFDDMFSSSSSAKTAKQIIETLRYKDNPDESTKAK